MTCLLALDALFVRLSAWRGWTKEVAWLGATLTVAQRDPVQPDPRLGYGEQSADVAARYQALEVQMAEPSAGRSSQPPGR